MTNTRNPKLETHTLSVAVVLLNWNGTGWLRRFLPGVVAHSVGATVIVVDNASTDDSVAVLRAEFAGVEVIVHPENLGFCGGYNRALAQLEGRFGAYLLLNTDVEVTPGWLAHAALHLPTDEPLRLGLHLPPIEVRRSHLVHGAAAL